MSTSLPRRDLKSFPLFCTLMSQLDDLYDLRRLLPLDSGRSPNPDGGCNVLEQRRIVPSL